MSYWDAVAGGLLIGGAAIWMYASLGRITGISGIAGRALRGIAGLESKQAWPWLFLLGLGLGGWLAYLMLGTRPEVMLSEASTLRPGELVTLALAGLIVGVGTRLGSGCTSGHGVCGLSRLSVRSLVATLTFLSVGMLTATLLDLF